MNFRRFLDIFSIFCFKPLCQPFIQWMQWGLLPFKRCVLAACTLYLIFLSLYQYADTLYSNGVVSIARNPYDLACHRSCIIDILFLSVFHALACSLAHSSSSFSFNPDHFLALLPIGHPFARSFTLALSFSLSLPLVSLSIHCLYPPRQNGSISSSSSFFFRTIKRRLLFRVFVYQTYKYVCECVSELCLSNLCHIFKNIFTISISLCK